MLVRALNGRADCLRNLGRLAEAANEAGHALATARELGDPAGEAYALYRLAAVEYYTGNRPRALTLLEQTQQINPATIPSWIARRCSIGLTTVLVDARDYPRARRHCAQALASAQQAGDQRDNGSCLARLTDIELSMGRVPEARMHLREALQIASRIGYRDLLSDCLDYCGYLCAATQRWEEAVTVWAARATAQRESGVLDLAQDARRRQEQMHRAQHALGPAQMRTADERGKAMSLTTAAEFATLQVTAEQQSTEPAPFPALSTRERELITMVAQGRTDAEIAGQLRISISTVRSHLARIRNKSGFRRRADLTRLALQEGLI
jgi:ATP/maltotriose-dependent transcriptional regulator MalT